ncbi:MAG TPA: chorismate-binding protein [Microthrixaceae bacterium]|nr:chorismate-binding protein [Microthrixaceae bacterium]HPG13129.1 chorismate-binding protein [Microthrixaceae bacterium]
MLTRDQFHRLARDHRVVPVTRTLLADLTTPVAAFARWCGPDSPADGSPARAGFLLESVDHGGRWGRWSFVGRDPRLRLVSRSGRVEVDGSLPDGLVGDLPTGDGILAVLEVLLEHLRAPTPDALAAVVGTSDAADGPRGWELPPLHSGVMGYLGYDVVREVEHLPAVPADDRGWPDAVLSVIGEIAAYDHWSQQVTLVANAFVADGADRSAVDLAYDDAVARLERMAADGATPIDEPLVEPPTRADESVAVTSSMSGGTYEAAVDAAKEHILAGDIFQVVLAQRFDFTTTAEPLDIYRTLRQVNPSPYMFLMREDDLTLVGCSPEPMVQLLDGRVISRPIAGTRFRGRTDEHDRRLAAELVEHPKERAEHIMLVDLARNDVGRVVEFGTCQVDELMTLERYSHVMHLTSQVSGALAEGCGPIDVLRATLPAGTVSGAPKVRAMEIIDELEPVKRGPYAGIVGYVDFSGNIDTAIAIRTMLVDPPGADGTRRACVQAGAGVVADSVAADEELETRNKAKALLSAVPAAERMTAHRRAAGGR